MVRTKALCLSFWTEPLGKGCDHGGIFPATVEILGKFVADECSV